MVFELSHKGHTVEFWQDNNNYVKYVIWFEEDVIKSDIFPDAQITIPEVKELLKGIIDDEVTNSEKDSIQP